MNKVWVLISFVSILYGLMTGRAEELSKIILVVPSESFTLLITMISSACFWNGIMNVMDEAGVVKHIAKMIKPLFRLIMPKLKDEITIKYLSMNIAANILGLGYGATPSGLKAVRRMKEQGGNKDEATDEMVTFLILNTAGVTLIPTTVMAIRSDLGSLNPADIIILPIIATLFACVVGLIFDYYFRRKYYDKKR